METSPSPHTDAGGPRDWLERMIDPRFLGIALGVNLLWLVFLVDLSAFDEVSRISDTLGMSPPGTRFTVTPAELYKWLAAIGGRGRDLYASVQWMDLLTPVLSAALLCPALLYLSRQLPARRGLLRGMAGVPLLTLVASWAEDIELLRILHAWPENLASAAATANLFNRVKLVTSSAAYLAILFGLVVLGLDKVREMRATQDGA